MVDSEEVVSHVSFHVRDLPPEGPDHSEGVIVDVRLITMVGICRQMTGNPEHHERGGYSRPVSLKIAETLLYGICGIPEMKFPETLGSNTISSPRKDYRILFESARW